MAENVPLLEAISVVSTEEGTRQDRVRGGGERPALWRSRMPWIDTHVDGAIRFAEPRHRQNLPGCDRAQGVLERGISLRERRWALHQPANTGEILRWPRIDFFPGRNCICG